MKTLRIGRKVVEVYDAIDELPITRFHKLNKFTLIDAGVGSDIASITSHIDSISRYIDKADKENAKKQLDNLKTSLYLVSQETNINHLSFMVLIKSIDGKEIYDISDNNMQKLLELFKNEQKSVFDKLIEFVKKKIDDELNLFFPGQFDNAAAKEYYDRLRRRTMLRLEAVINGVDNSFKIAEVDDFLLMLAKPKIFSGKDSVEIKYEKQFEEMCLFLKKELNIDPTTLTVLQFYHSFDFIKKNRPKTLKNGRKPN